MLTAYRLIKKEHLSAPPGEGAFKFGGRWNKLRESVVYCSASKSLAALEILVNIQPMTSLNFFMLEIFIPASVSLDKIALKQLPKKWRETLYLTENMGSKWLKEAKSCVLQVPSVIIPSENNYLINPNHKDFKNLLFSKPITFHLDHRLLSS